MNNNKTYKNKTYLVVIVFALAVILRISVLFAAHHGDLNNNISWGKKAAESGIKSYYDLDEPKDWQYSVPNQPPLSIILFGSVMKMEKVIGKLIWNWNLNYRLFPSRLVWFWEERGVDLMIKLPSLIADVGIGWMIYHYIIQKLKIKNQKDKRALLIASVWLFNPITWYNSSLWGQTDSIVNLLGLIAIIYLLNKRLEIFAVFFSLSLLFKASLGIFIPILCAIIYLQKYRIKTIFKSIVFATLTILLVGIWFHPEIDFFAWIFDLYRTRILPGEIGSLTANAFNFWWLVDSGQTLDSKLFLGIPARFLGYIVAILPIFIFLFPRLRAKFTEKMIWFSLALSALIAFLFLTRIHPRYLYPFFPAATIYLAFVPSFWVFYLILTVFHFLNIYYLFWIPPFPVLERLYDNPLFTNTLAFIPLVVLAITFVRLQKRYN